MVNRTNIFLGLIILLSFIIFFPSLFNFYSHDDFFHLTISRAESFTGFLNFFNPASAPAGFGFYRPLTTQVFYFLSISLFRLSPLPLHIISFAVFFTVIILVFKLANRLLKNTKAALLAAFLYAVSSTHFGHLYYLGAFQELGLAFFFFFSAFCFIKFLTSQRKRDYFLSFIFFIGALMSKEFAVMLPPVLLIMFFYLKRAGEKVIPFKNVVLALTPFLCVLAAYLFFHFFYYGLAKGDSYIWEISPRVFNTFFWYVVWSFGLPEMLLDFVGPRLTPVPNLFKYYGGQIIPILGAFAVLAGLAGWLVIVEYRRVRFKNVRVYIFAFIWFSLTLLPVLFLPWHKFTYELTVPLFGLVLGLGLLLSKAKRITVSLFLIIFLMLSVLSLKLTAGTHWITQGGKASRSIVNYLSKYPADEGQKTAILFYDTEKDNGLPWKPSQQLKTILGDNNFFKVNFKNRFEAFYGNTGKDIDGASPVKLEARWFLGYD